MGLHLRALHAQPCEIRFGPEAEFRGVRTRFSAPWAFFYCSGVRWPPRRCTRSGTSSSRSLPPAEQVSDLSILTIAICATIFVVVGGLMAYAVIRFGLPARG